MKFLILCLASILVGASSAIPVQMRPAEDGMVEIHYLQKSELPAFLLLRRRKAMEADNHAATFLDDEGVQPLIDQERNEQYLEEVGEPFPVQMTRFRRSTQPRGNQGNGDRGSVDVDVSRTRDGGTRVDASGRGTVWESRDRNGRVEVHGHYGRDYGGRYGTGRPNYGGGIRYTHRF